MASEQKKLEQRVPNAMVTPMVNQQNKGEQSLGLSLSSRFRALPTEIKHEILVWLLVFLLRRGRLYASTGEDPAIHRTSATPDPLPISIPTFSSSLGLSTLLTRKAHEIYYSQNTWVMPSGMSMAPIRQLLESAGDNHIRSVELVFHMDDAEWSPGTRTEFVNFLARKAAEEGDTAFTVAGANAIYDDMSGDWALDLLDVWKRKFNVLKDLGLEHLKLDFRIAYDIDHEFMGWELLDVLGEFEQGIPVHFEVVARTPELEGELLEEFERINTGKGTAGEECSFCRFGFHA